MISLHINTTPDEGAFRRALEAEVASKREFHFRLAQWSFPIWKPPTRRKARRERVQRNRWRREGRSTWTRWYRTSEVEERRYSTALLTCTTPGWTGRFSIGVDGALDTSEAMPPEQARYVRHYVEEP